jgi:hypothetical protein
MRPVVIGAALLVSTIAHAAQPDVVSISPVRNTMAAATTAVSITFDEPLLTTGTQSVSLKEGLVAGKAKITFKGKGAPLAMPTPDSFTGPIAVRLHRSGAATCWGADFSAPFLKHDGTQLKDTSD